MEHTAPHALGYIRKTVWLTPYKLQCIMANIIVNNNLIGIMYHNSKDTCHILYVLGSGYLLILLKNATNTK